MDEIVRAAMAKWPQVPHCRGWLGLDARGDWWLRDELTQAAGAFPKHKGSRIEHIGLREFICRNYAADDDGAWYFQNGPQRVYAELEAAPWIWRLEPSAAGPVLRTHTGRPARREAALVDERGRLFLATDIGLGLVHSLDMADAADRIEAEAWPVEPVRFADLSQRFGYRLTAV